MGDQHGQIGVVTALARSAFLVNAAYVESGRKFGLTPQQGQFLCVLRPHPYGMSRLGAVLGLAKSSVTGLVDRLEQRSLVSRQTDADDSRATQVSLTPSGVEVADEFYRDTHGRIEHLLDSLTDQERKNLGELLRHIVASNTVSVIFMEDNE